MQTSKTNQKSESKFNKTDSVCVTVISIHVHRKCFQCIALFIWYLNKYVLIATPKNIHINHDKTTAVSNYQWNIKVSCKPHSIVNAIKNLFSR
jgi:hypothetical protein